MTALATSLGTRVRVAVVLLTVGVLTGSLLERRATQRRARDAGFTTIEWVVIALGLFLIAGIAVAAITTAVQSRLDRITPAG
ncbi:hypothetical protein [Aquipuribacter sp. SD81]|uniref:hypothetical protein n=1 Tax=Aquipuribacter sp. SD81 TaxID=3127703 RepID=UPI0030197F65